MQIQLSHGIYGRGQINIGHGLVGRNTLASLLFTDGSQGFTFEPWDITTLYQDRAGTTPVTAAGQSVGYRRDKSGRGNHEVAINDAARGIYGWMPKTGRRNLLTYTEQFNNVYWSKLNVTVSTSTVVDPAGGTSARLLTPSASASVTWVFGPVITTSVVSSISVFAKYSGKTWMSQSNSNGNVIYASFNLMTGEVGFVASNYTATMESVGDGWYRCTVTTPTNFSQRAIFSVSDTDGGKSATPNGSDGILFWGAQLEAGSTATAYQRVASQYDVTEAGVPTCYYVQADGVDDAYVTPTITPNTDKVQVFAGVRKLSDSAAYQVIVESSTNIDTTNGALVLATNIGTYKMFSKGTVRTSASASGYAVPITNVVSASNDISGDRVTLRVNGTQVAQSTSDQGTGNFLAYPAYIYARGGTTLPFNGLDFGHAVRFGPNLDAATIARVESLIARNTPEVTL